MNVFYHQDLVSPAYDGWIQHGSACSLISLLAEQADYPLVIPMQERAVQRLRPDQRQLIYNLRARYPLLQPAKERRQDDSD